MTMKTPPNEMQQVRHVNSKGTYVVTALGQMKVGSAWVPSVSYEAVGKINPINYTREKTDFMQAFEEL